MARRRPLRRGCALHRPRCHSCQSSRARAMLTTPVSCCPKSRSGRHHKVSDAASQPAASPADRSTSSWWEVGRPARSSPPGSPRTRPAGRARRGRAAAARARGDAGRVRGAAAEPRDRLDVHRRRRRLRSRARRRPDDGAARQDARRLVGHQLHGLRPRPSGRLRLVGRGRRHRAGATTTCCPTSRRARAWPPSGDIVVDADAHNTEGPLGVSVRAPVLAGARGVRRRRGRGRHPDAATTTAATAAARTASCRSCRPRPATASGRARTTRSSRATLEQRPNLEVICGAQVTRVILEDGPAGLRATGVEYRDRRRRDRPSSTPTKEVVLSAGRGRFAALLLLSGIGPKRRARGGRRARAGSTRPTSASTSRTTCRSRSSSRRRASASR